MSGECEKCGEHCLDCICDNYQCPPPIKSYSASCLILEFSPTFQEVSKQMRINVDILKQELTDHVDKELKRFNKELNRKMNQFCSECKNENVACVCMEE